MKSVFVIEHESNRITIADRELICKFIENMLQGNVLICSHTNQNSKGDLCVPNAFPDGATFSIPVALQGMRDLKRAKMKEMKEKRNEQK